MDKGVIVRPGAKTALALLFLVATVNYIDRQILVILLQPIKVDLGLSDTQLGLLTGVAFALFFAIAGFPIARLAERHSRRTIISVSLAAWSLLTAACGLAQTFSQLMGARILAAIGESGSGPASQSMIADLYGHGRRSGALAVLTCSIPVGILIGLAAGGTLNAMVGWRLAFTVVGLPGAVLAVIFFAVVRDPRGPAVNPSLNRQSTLSAIRDIWAIRSYRLIAIAAALHLFAAAAFNQWIASYLMRAYRLGTADVGVSLGLIIGIAGGIGTLFGGMLGDRLGRHDPRWFGWLPALIALMATPLTLAVYLSPSYAIALPLLIGPVLTATAYTGPVFGAVQSLAPSHLRSTAAAVTMMAGAIIGQAGGPLFVGMVSDFLSVQAGPDALRWALCAATPASLIAAWLFWLAGRSMSADMNAAEQQAAGLPDQDANAMRSGPGAI